MVDKSEKHPSSKEKSKIFAPKGKHAFECSGIQYIILWSNYF